jgi:hypothetical protein
MGTGKRCVEINDAEWQVRNWIAAWIIDDVIQLVPELQKETRRQASARIGREMFEGKGAHDQTT